MAIRSGYVVAGFETLAGIVDNFIKNKKNRYTDNFSREEVSKFLSTTCSGYLHSYGQEFKGKKKYSKYNQNEAKMFQKCRDMTVFDNCQFIADSGGFQIASGMLTLKESELLLKMYYEFLEDHHSCVDKAFILDVPPGPASCEIFHNFEQLFDLNLWSYQRAKNLPKEVRDKLIYIHHFRTPKLWEIYTKIMREYDMFDSFQYFGTGGIVANMRSDLSIPCIIYVLPIIPLLNECIKHKRKVLNFHVLGGSNFRDILFYELFKLVVKEKHDIELNITYDSSGLFKGLMRGRYIYVFDGDKFIKMDIRTKNLNMRLKDNIKVIDMCRKYVKDLTDKYPYINPLQINDIYEIGKNGKPGTFYEDVKVYLMFSMLDQFSVIQEMMRKKAEEIYPLYKANCIDEFLSETTNITQSLNSGKLTKKQQIKSISIKRSLDMLESLDEDYCKYIVDTFLVKDEFVDLDPNTKLLSI